MHFDNRCLKKFKRFEQPQLIPSFSKQTKLSLLIDSVYHEKMITPPPMSAGQSIYAGNN